MVATAAFAFMRRPEKMIINSYHHHSKQTDTQLGMAKVRRDLHSLKHSVDQPPQHLLWMLEL